MDNDDIIFGPVSLLQEVRSMQGLSNVYFSMSPRWIRPVGSLSSCYTSLTFAFLDPDGTITKQLFKERQALFRKQILLERWVNKPLLQYLQVLTVSEHRSRGSFLIQTCLVRLISPAVGRK